VVIVKARWHGKSVTLAVFVLFTYNFLLKQKYVMQNTKMYLKLLMAPAHVNIS